MSARKSFSYSLIVNGLCGRERKPKYHSFDLADEVKLEHGEALGKLIADKLKEVGYKSGRIQVCEYPTEYEERESSTGRVYTGRVIEITRGVKIYDSQA
jgi:hypothetical protein